MLAAGGALLLAPLAGCASERGPLEVTRVVFDGETYMISGHVSCATQPDGNLLIHAPSRSGGISATGAGGKKLVRLVVSETNRLVVEAAGFRFLDVSGFTADSSEMWASKVDDTFTISGRMPPADGETMWHQFTIEVTCTSRAGLATPQNPYSD